jgi:PAS domain S-box-containing protein
LPQLQVEFCQNAACRLIESNLGVGIWSLDPVTDRSYWSRGFYELLGLDPGTVSPSYEEFDRRTHPDDRCPKHELKALLREGSSINRDLRIIRPNGRLHWISSQIELLLDAAGRPVSIQGLAHDITKHREALLSLRGDADRYSAFLGIVEGLVWTADPNGCITAPRNGKTPKQNGPNLPYGSSWLYLLHEDERDVALEDWAASVEKRRPYDAVHRVLQQDGTYRWSRSRATPILNPDGSIQEWIGKFADAPIENLSSLSAPSPELTGAQIRGARGILNWSVKQLAERAGISPAVVRRLEENDGILQVRRELVETLRKILSDAGIELLFLQFGKPGIRPR